MPSFWHATSSKASFAASSSRASEISCSNSSSFDSLDNLVSHLVRYRTRKRNLLRDECRCRPPAVRLPVNTDEFAVSRGLRTRRQKGSPPMTRFLARLADIAYRRRGRVVLAWIAATVVIIGVGSSLAGEYNADYNTPGSESKAASDLTETRVRRLLRPGDLRRLEGPATAPRRRTRSGASTPSSPRPSASSTSPRRPRPASREDGTIATTTLPLTVAGLGRPEGGRREADRRGRAPQRRRAGDQARRRPDLRGAGGGEPRGHRLPRRRDRAADRVRLGRRRRPAAR